jgi:nitrite reductase (cytochrome c-552)
MNNSMRKYCSALLVIFSMSVSYGCAPEKPEPVKTVSIADGAIDPEQWGKAYPAEYELWKKTSEPTPAGKSRYRRGSDAGETAIDKLDEYPFLALLYNGWGFGVEYREPRGHHYMIIDQLEIDPSRLKAGGGCLTCKTPYAPFLEKKMGKDYFSKPYHDVLNRIPEKHRTLGAACIDCHNNKDMTLRISHEFTLSKALKQIGVDESKLTVQDKRSLVCAQCHVTYRIPKDADMKSTDVAMPWSGGKWGGISIEGIIKDLRGDPANREWTQGVTGFRMAFIRHPEFELFSNKSVHWNAGVACADCHMPYTRAGTKKVSDHRIMSPLKNDLRACGQCHAESPDALRRQVYAIQDRTTSLYIRAGYGTATVAKLFETANRARADGAKLDPKLYDTARNEYEEAFYRLVFIGAENSAGFHNPSEAMRVLGDASRHAGKAEGLLRQALALAGIDVPVTIELELDKYRNNRGVKKLMAKPDHEIKDPMAGQ